MNIWAKDPVMARLLGEDFHVAISEESDWARRKGFDYKRVYLRLGMGWDEATVFHEKTLALGTIPERLCIVIS